MIKKLQLQKPHVVVVVGIPGSGKTFFAEKFSDMFTAPFLDFSTYRQAIADPDQAMQLASTAFLQLLRTRESVVIEGIGELFSERQTMHDIAKKNGYDVFYVWIQTEPATAKRRSVQAKDATMNEDEFMQRLEQFDNFKKGEAFVVVSGRHTYATQAKTVLRRLVDDRPTTDPSIHKIVPPRGRVMG